MSDLFVFVLLRSYIIVFFKIWTCLSHQPLRLITKNNESKHLYELIPAQSPVPVAFPLVDLILQITREITNFVCSTKFVIKFLVAFSFVDDFRIFDNSTLSLMDRLFSLFWPSRPLTQLNSWILQVPWMLFNSFAFIVFYLPIVIIGFFWLSRYSHGLD